MSWQLALQQGFSQAVELLKFLDLDPSHFPSQAEQLFKTKVPLGFAQRMQKHNPNDPLLLQVLAQNQEFETQDGFVNDPLQEKTFNPLPGLIHKYHNRVLLTVTGTCAVHCRYCFRRHFPYQDNLIKADHMDAIVAYITTRPQIEEVIFSGGDPLLLSDGRMAHWIQNLSNIRHLKTLRIHSRIPIVLPERLTPEWLDLWTQTPLKKVLVIHANHAQEFDAHVAHALEQLRAHGFALLNQSVLLNNINDDAHTLKKLHDTLWTHGVLPYYLHYPDRVAGTWHFDVSHVRALQIYEQLQSISSGYLVPKLVQEKAGEPHKVLMY